MSTPPAGPIRVAALHAVISGLKLPNGLEIDEIHLDGESATIVPKPFSWSIREPGTLRAVVSQESIQRLVSGKLTGEVKEVRLALTGGKIHVRATVQMLISLTGTIVCDLSIVDGKQLVLGVVSVDIAGAAGKAMVQKMLDKFNPIFDAANLPVNATLQSVVIEEGRVVLTGTVEPSA